MTVSNPKQIILLSVIAVGAVAFLAVTVTGLGKNVVSRMSATVRERDDEKEKPGLPLELLGDPFSHPQLTSAAAQADAESKTIGETPPTVPMPPALAAGLGGLSGFGPLQTGIDPETGPGIRPAENAGKSRNEEGEKRPSVALSAIVKVNRPVALLSINGGDSRAFREGELVYPGIRLIQIESGSVRLRTPLKSFEVKVGGVSKS